MLRFLKKSITHLDMPFLPKIPFNPTTTPVAILGPSSGNPKSLQDPKSVASIGSNIQAMTDQANADTLYDVNPSKTEGFTCRFSSTPLSVLTTSGTLIVIGIALILYSVR